MGCLLTNSLHMLSGACRLYCTAYLRHACASWQPGPAACLFVAAGLDAWHTPNSCLSPACNKCNTCFACCAGHLELQATSMLLQRNLCVYQSGQPVWQIKNHPEVRPAVEGPARPAGLPACLPACQACWPVCREAFWRQPANNFRQPTSAAERPRPPRHPTTVLPVLQGTPVLHISYHDQIHYNSVRNSNDYGSGPPESLRMGGASSSGVAAADPKAVAAGACAFGAREVDQVVAGTGCSDRERIARVLEQCCGSIDQAIELLIEQLGQEGEEEEAAAGAAGAVAAAAAAASGQQQGELQQDVAAPAGEKQQQQQHQPAATQPAGAAGRATDAQEQRQCGDDCIRLELRKHPEDLHRITARLLATGASPAILQQQQPAAAAPGEQQRLEQEQQQPTAAAEEEAAADPEQAGEQKGGKRAGSSRKGVKLKGDKVAAHPARNQRCPCGSTRKYKNCCLHGAKQQEAAGAAAAADASGAAAQLQVLYI